MEGNCDTAVLIHGFLQILRDTLSTRNSTLTGLRNIVRCVFQNDIQTLTVPLLLVTEYTEVSGRL